MLKIITTYFSLDLSLDRTGMFGTKVFFLIPPSVKSRGVLMEGNLKVTLHYIYPSIHTIIYTHTNLTTKLHIL